MNIQSKNAPLIIGLLLVIFVIVVIIGIAVLPNKFYQPEHDFLYTYKADYYPNNYLEYKGYEVKNGKLEEKIILVSGEVLGALPLKVIETPYEERIYIYEIGQGASRELTLEEAQELTLDPNTISPDGFEIDYGSRTGGFLFFVDVSRDYSTRYLVGHGARHKVNLIQDNSYDNYRSSRNFKFLGWVK